MKKTALIFSFLALSSLLLANTAIRNQYIDQYRDLAISEMQRTGIPASIKLAQAILESNAGQSTLAREANNHFGIKCGAHWTGRTFYRKDDDRNKNGKLIKSCFRSFKDPVDSFIEHSDFLSVQNRRRYGFLFDFDRSDYTSWAFGLKKAGYATHADYPKLLIKLIEEFRLYQYDRTDSRIDIVASTTPSRPAPTPVINRAPKKKRTESNSVFASGSAGEISMEAFKTKIAVDKINKVTMTYTTEGDHIGMVAMRSGIPVEKLIKYNDGIDTEHQRLVSGTKVYLAKKKSSYKGQKKFHYVRVEDNMKSISQHYGILLKALYNKNGMPMDSEPAVGEKIRLKGKAAKNKIVKTKMLRTERPSVILTSAPALDEQPKSNISYNERPSVVKEKPVDVVEIITDPVVPSSSISSRVVQWEDTPTATVTSEQSSEVTYHIVSKGETLWRISQNNATTVQALRSLNDLTSNNIYPGQKLRTN